MADYRKMYHILFNVMSDAAEKMLLAMQEAEKIYLDDDDTPLVLSQAEAGKPSALQINPPKPAKQR